MPEREIPLKDRPIVYPDGESPASRERKRQEAEERRQEIGVAMLRVRRNLGSSHPAFGRAVRQAEHDVRRKARRERRRAAKTGYLEESLDEPAERGDFLVNLANIEQVGRLVGALPEKEREVLVAMFLLGLDRGETASRIGTSKQAVTKLRERALRSARISGDTP